MAWKNVQYENGKYRTSEGEGGGSSTFAGLDDVSFSDIQNGQVPKYNSTTQKWENANESGGGGTVTDVQVDGVSVVNQQGVAEITMPTPPSVPDELSDLSDVQFSNLTDHQPLRYNATSQKWVNGADSFPPLIYSDEEREIGVWRDGKPLYQKTFVSNYTFHTTSSQTVNIDIHDLNIDTPVTINGFWRRWAGDNAKLWYQFGSDESQYGIAWARIDSENSYPNGRLAIMITSDGSDCQIVTLQYTKTTDTAGSGTWTTQGGYAHHYSTSEKVIGTWIDGKPLYEKTIEISNLTTEQWAIYSHNIPNISMICNLQGIYLRDSNHAAHTLSYFESGSYNAIVTTNETTIYYYITGLGSGKLFVTLQYTKTTD